MNMGFGIYDPNGDDYIDRGKFCKSNYIEDDILSRIDTERDYQKVREKIQKVREKMRLQNCKRKGFKT